MSWRRSREKPKQSAYSYGLWLLSQRNYSRAKLESKLVTRGYEAEEAERGVKELISRVFLVEKLYTSTKIGSLIRRGHSQKSIKRQLSFEKADLEPEQVETAFAEAGVSERDQLHALIEKKLRLVRKLPAVSDWLGWQKLRNRIFSAAALKGHSLSLLNQVWNEALAARISLQDDGNGQ